MDLRFSEEQRMVRKTARLFAEREISDRDRSFKKAMFETMGQEGLLGGPVPLQYDGGGCDFISYALLLEEIGRVSSSFRSAISVQISLVALTILAWGTEAQKRRYLPRLCRGEWIGCFGLTEPDAGSDAASLTTRAKPADGGWRLTGTKTFITNGGWADLALVFAQTDPEMGIKGLAAFILDRDVSPFVSVPIRGKLGLKASETSELIFEEIFVSDKNLLGKVGEGFQIAMSALDQGRFSVSAGCVGMIEGCLEAAIQHAKSRHQFGKPLAGFQLVQEMLARMKVDADAARLLVYRVALMKDEGLPDTLEVSIAKLFASEAALRAANDALQIFGSSGYLDESPVARYYRDAKATTIYEGTSEIQKLIIGHHLTGIRAFA